MINSVGLQGPGVHAWRRRRPARPGRDRAPGSWPASGAATSTTTARAADRPRRLPARRSWRSRSTCRAPTSTAAPTCSPTIPRPPPRSWRRPPACGRPRWAKLSANTDRVVEVAGAAAAGRRRGGHPDQHAARDGDRSSRRADRCSAVVGAESPARPSARLRYAPSTTCTPRCPDLPIVGVGGDRRPATDAVEMLHGGCIGRRSWHGDRSPIHDRPHGCSTVCEHGAVDMEYARSAS